MPARSYLMQYALVKKREDGSPDRRIVTVNGLNKDSADSLRKKYDPSPKLSTHHCLYCGVRLTEKEHEHIGQVCFACY